MLKNLALIRNLLTVPGVASVVLALAVPVTLYLLPKDVLGTLDFKLTLPLFGVQFVLIVLLAISLRGDFLKFFRPLLADKTCLGFTVVVILALSVFAGTQIEARHRVQSDEAILMAVAQNMYYNHVSGTCNQGEFKQGELNCKVQTHPFKLKALPALYFLGMHLFGKDLHWAFVMQLVCFPLAMLLFYFAILAWTRSGVPALLATALLASQPMTLFQFRSLSVEPLYVLLFALSLLLVKFASEQGSWRHWALAALVLAFFAQTRQETVFCFAAFLLLAWPSVLDSKSAKAPVFILLLAVFSAPALVTISYFQNFGFQGGEFAAHGHFLEHLKADWLQMTSPGKLDGLPKNPFLPYFNYLFLLGAVVLVVHAALEVVWQKPKRALTFLAFQILFHIQTYVILENVSGDFSIHINQRYSLVFFPALSLLAAYPFWLLLEFANKKSKGKVLPVAALLLACVPVACAFDFKKAFNANIMYKRNHLTMEEAEIWKWLGSQDKAERFFIYGRPVHFTSYGISATHYDKVRKMNDEKVRALLERYGGEVYYVRGLDCWDSETYHKKAVEKRIATTCDHFESEMSLSPVYEATITNNYKLEISKFLGKKAWKDADVLKRGKLVTDSLGTRSVEFFLNVEEAHPWKVKASINGEQVYDAPYAKGKIMLLETGGTRGYSKLLVQVVDTLKNDVVLSRTEFLAPRDSSAVMLGTMTPAAHTQGWGKMKVNKSVEDKPLKLDGVAYPEGFGLHAPSKTTFRLGGAYDSLSAVAGLDEESLCSKGGSLKILADGAQIYAGTLTYAPVLEIGLGLGGVQELTFETEFKDKDCAHFDLAIPLLYKRKE